MTVRKQKVHSALVWLINNNPHYSEITINEDALTSLPENGVPPDLMTVETDNDISDDNCSVHVGPPTDNPSVDIVYNDSTEMSSFLPVKLVNNNNRKLKLSEISFLKMNQCNGLQLKMNH